MAVLGVDIGGSTIKAAAVDLVAGALRGDMVEVPTPQPAPPDALAAAVTEAVRQVEAADPEAAEGPIGCTFPGRIRAGCSLSAVNLSEAWIGERPGDVFEAALAGAGPPRPVHIVNDADAAGLAEMRFGAGAERDGVVVLVTLGTGVGSALFVDGTLVPNTELGEIEVDGRPASEVASRLAKEEQGLDWEAWAENVGRFLQRLQDLVDPDLVIVGGGVSDHPERLRPALRQPCEVVPAELGNAAGVIGAALFASQRAGSAAAPS